MGKVVPLSLGRRVVCDAADQTRQIPQASVARRMNLGDLARARAAAVPKPSWNSLFTKGYAKVASVTPELRQVFLRWPWARLYVHHETIIAIMVEIEVAGEKTVAVARIVGGQDDDLIALDHAVGNVKNRPDRVRWHRHAMMVARLPRFLRRILWWLALECSGYRRARTFGTSQITSVAFAGGYDALLVTSVGNALHYGIVDQGGNAWLRMAFDPRIMDGACAARALVKLEHILNTDILAEVRALQAKAAA